MSPHVSSDPLPDVGDVVVFDVIFVVAVAVVGAAVAVAFAFAFAFVVVVVAVVAVVGLEHVEGGVLLLHGRLVAGGLRRARGVVFRRAVARERRREGRGGAVVPVEHLAASLGELHLDDRGLAQGLRARRPRRGAAAARALRCALLAAALGHEEAQEVAPGLALARVDGAEEQHVAVLALVELQTEVDVAVVALLAVGSRDVGRRRRRVGGRARARRRCCDGRRVHLSRLGGGGPHGRVVHLAGDVGEEPHAAVVDGLQRARAVEGHVPERRLASVEGLVGLVVLEAVVVGDDIAALPVAHKGTEGTAAEGVLLEPTHADTVVVLPEGGLGPRRGGRGRLKLARRHRRRRRAGAAAGAEQLFAVLRRLVLRGLGRGRQRLPVGGDDLHTFAHALEERRGDVARRCGALATVLLLLRLKLVVHVGGHNGDDLSGWGEGRCHCYN
eukprot:PhM_4_TR8451/c3_g1_i3/m.1406